MRNSNSLLEFLLPECKNWLALPKDKVEQRMAITVKKADEELKEKCKRFVRVLQSPSVASLTILPHQGASICISSPSEAPVQVSFHDNHHLISHIASKLTRKHPPPRAFQLADVGMRGIYLSLDLLPGLPPSRAPPPIPILGASYSGRC
jgi:hypothetical protein